MRPDRRVHAALASVMLTAAWAYPAPTGLVGVQAGGVLLGAGWLALHASQRMLVGVRTAWTLRSDEIWRCPHALARPVFRIGGLIVIAASIAAPAVPGRTTEAVPLTTLAVLPAASYVFAVHERRRTP
ncbi:MAG: SdpI family protein [Acidobacteriota bacterium]